ncbi:MAG TPA: fasciclin domain-containing protein [Thermohalobaculum sp.]|nr:fasciclin domain-containing protein [Thermohalobaculum sp.]
MLMAACSSNAEMRQEAKMDIVEVAQEGGQFSTLVAAVGAAGLAETLKSPGPFTVFAPTDEAFAKLPAGTVETLLKPENKDQLVAILTYHVVPGEMKAGEVVAASQLQTAQGSALDVVTSGGDVMVGKSKVIATDIDASNGVIHVIDTVLLPPEA